MSDTLPRFSLWSVFWSVSAALLAAPVVAFFVDRQIVAACCENGPDYDGALMLSAILIPIIVLLFSPLMIAGSGLIFARIKAERHRLAASLHAIMGFLVGAALGWGGFSQFPPWLGVVAYPGANGLLPGGLTGALAALGWWWGMHRAERARGEGV